ncbi:hypothetical protein AHF37_00789 [Paragonimus kellicotti]|nr:hypothetical protein AHF37_00789 [Paragonimus kellicotti]
MESGRLLCCLITNSKYHHLDASEYRNPFYPATHNPVFQVILPESYGSLVYRPVILLHLRHCVHKLLESCLVDLTVITEQIAMFIDSQKSFRVLVDVDLEICIKNSV